MKSKKRLTLIITLIILFGVPVSLYLYEKKKEDDRQALIQMHDSIRNVIDEYEQEENRDIIDEFKYQINKRNNTNNSLAEDYTNLRKLVIDSKKSSFIKDKFCQLEKEIMKLDPTVYTNPSSVCK
ncbi:hypothetical protein Back11_05290 [Paenibacillus baekrokdamisoli]|uniref:Uncharacterized protein n=1 Tax=Paenibacillus baekrokdamisoli TaxID=1712516 RepID=A0A3G9J776_9BACL|nr:hypothetical protein [Paenibacillus baekrokdamisoli]MBB3067629.1 uncharacterized coiled-coil DUF342 family protein [Paenibacillus baekrokdamisoli]BBH19184.1 hypothetical protein Back11_05290 [Paenibacillus baekrokdamisoli]